MNSTTVSAGTFNNEDYVKRMAMLEKPWADATIEEKLEKVREELTQLGYLSHNITNINLEVAKLQEHSHTDGKVVIPLKSQNGMLNGLGGQAVRRNNLA